MVQYLRNCWYMAAWADDIPCDRVLVRTLLGIPVVMYRDAEDRPVALLDRCPHRFAPLSLGAIRGDSLVCRYHGLAFGPGGKCSGNPHGPITSAMAVRSFPLVQRHRALWIWMGDPAKADPEAIRDLSFLERAPETALSKGYLHGNGEYQLFVDNILDLTHADFLHPTTLGGGSFTQTRAKIEAAEQQLTIAWHSQASPPSPLAAKRLPGHTLVDSWTDVEWTAPSVMVLRNGSAPVGTDRKDIDEVTNVHVLTPESDRTCHYFFASTRNFDMDSAEVNEAIRVTRERIFSTEDEPIIRLQQERMGATDFWELNPILLRTDEGPVRVRRILAKLISQEQESN